MQTVTHLFSDIEGSTRLWEERPGDMPLALAGHDSAARAAVADHHGRVVKTTGDGIHAVFERAADALASALQLQLALLDPAATNALALRVRCGLHVGAGESRDGDFYGPTVNRAARIMGAAHGGQTLLSQALVEALGHALPPDTGLLDLGRVRLRDLSQPEHVFQLRHPRLRERFPPLRSLEGTPNNLVQRLDSFVGRELELAEAARLLAGNRLLTLLGMGGIGKSRLSVQLAADVIDRHPDGVWLVELAALTDPALVPQAVASVMGVKEDAGTGVAAALAKYVADKRLLLVLDNCEHVLQACAELAKRLLQAGAGVTLLASSRAALQIAGEAAYQVPTLSVPERGQAIAPDALMRHASVRLFVERAVAAQSTFRLTTANAAAVAEICHRLDGIPLAIELAAARTRSLAASAIAERLSDRFRLLVTTDHTVLPRQRTLRALIDWSHDLLPAAERVLFRRLAVFAGGWTLDAAEAVCAGHGLESRDVLAALAQLVEQSLVVMDATGTRYRLLDTVRQYALEKLAEAGDDAATQALLLEFCVGEAERARPGLAGPDQGLWLSRLDLERENFLAAHRGSELAHDGDALALRLMHALRPYWVTRGQLTIGLRLALDVLDRPGSMRRDESRCKALFAAGQLSFLMGRNADAHRHLAECLSIARETNNAAVVARVLQPLGMTSLGQNDFPAAHRYLDEALLRATQLGDRRELAAASNALGMLHRIQSDLDAAQPLCERVVELARELGDQESVGIGLLNQAMVAIGRGSTAPARAMLAEALQIATATGSEPIAQSATEVCAGLAAATCRWADAAAFFGSAQRQRQRSGLRRDPADEAFLAPLIEATRAALSPSDFERSASGAPDTLPGAGLQRVSAWLAAPPGG